MAEFLNFTENHSIYVRIMLVVACYDIVIIDALYLFFISQVMNVFIVGILKNEENSKEEFKTHYL